MNTNDVQFTYTALCFAKIITIIKKRFVIKRHQHKASLSANRRMDPGCFLLSFDRIIFNLERKGLYNMFKKSFWNWALSLCIIQLKTLDKNSKEYLYDILHKKLNKWDYIDKSLPTSNRYRALHYIKNQKKFPTINIAYAINHKYFNLCLTSIKKKKKNSLYEHLNFILLYNDITESEIRKINELKEIRSFSLQTLYIANNEFDDYTLTKWITKEAWYRCILADKFPYIDKILLINKYLFLKLNIFRF